MTDSHEHDPTRRLLAAERRALEAEQRALEAERRALEAERVTLETERRALMAQRMAEHSAMGAAAVVSAAQQFVAAYGPSEFVIGRPKELQDCLSVEVTRVSLPKSVLEQLLTEYWASAGWVLTPASRPGWIGCQTLGYSTSNWGGLTSGGPAKPRENFKIEVAMLSQPDCTDLTFHLWVGTGARSEWASQALQEARRKYPVCDSQAAWAALEELKKKVIWTYHSEFAAQIVVELMQYVSRWSTRMGDGTGQNPSRPR